jgi:hypothetical protein
MKSDVETVANSEDESSASTQSRVVNESGSVVITADATFTLESYNLTNNYTKEMEYTVPLEMIGMTRDELVAYIEQYTNEQSQEEQKMVSYKLISFASNHVVIRKTYRSTEDAEYTYYIKSVAGKLMVYLADQVSLYIETDIDISELPQEEQEEVTEGKYITNIQELFRYLESYTS